MKCYQCGQETDDVDAPGWHVVGDFARCLRCRINDVRDSYAHGSGGQGGAYEDVAYEQFDDIVAALWQAAYEAGVEDERTSVELTDGQVPPNRSNPFRKDPR